MVVLSPPVTHNLANAYVNTSASKLDHDYLVETADKVLSYSLGNDDAGLPIGTDDKTAMTEDALQHLRDVRVVFITTEIAAVIVTILLAATSIYLIRKHGKGSLSQPLIIGGIVPLVLVLILGILGIISFDVLFTAMHKIFFADGTWTFAYDSLLISALPQPFWIGCAVVWAIALIILCLFSVVIGLMLKRSKPA
jgi:integral membrane protein (TIGR01906 family)